MNKNDYPSQEMYSLSSKIGILKRAEISKAKFINDQIGQMVITEFTCCSCGHQNKIELIPYESGFPIIQLYSDAKVLNEGELLENKMLTKTTPWMQHLGELTFNDLPTLYFGTECENCNSKFMGIFCYGEKQPGLTILEISGVWEYITNS